MIAAVALVLVAGGIALGAAVWRVLRRLRKPFIAILKGYPPGPFPGYLLLLGLGLGLLLGLLIALPDLLELDRPAVRPLRYLALSSVLLGLLLSICWGRVPRSPHSEGG